MTDARFIALAVDPGPTKTSWLILDGDDLIGMQLKEPNESFVVRLRQWRESVPLQFDRMVMETIEPWGGGFVGQPALDTKYWVGRFEEAIHPIPTRLFKRSVILRTLEIGRLPKGQAQSAVRAKLIDRWGGGNPVKRDHPLHGVTDDLWSALAVGVAWSEQGGQ